MLETAIQKLVVDAVNECGGHAFKAANRFLVGVVDLSVKLPYQKGHLEPLHAFIEVKKHDIQWGTKAARVTTEITKKQHDFMRDYKLAGGIAGIASFLDGANVSELRMAMIPVQEGVLHYSTLTSSFNPLGNASQRAQSIVINLRNFING